MNERWANRYTEWLYLFTNDIYENQYLLSYWKLSNEWLVWYFSKSFTFSDVGTLWPLFECIYFSSKNWTNITVLEFGRARTRIWSGNILTFWCAFKTNNVRHRQKINSTPSVLWHQFINQVHTSHARSVGSSGIYTNTLNSMERLKAVSRD